MKDDDGWSSPLPYFGSSSDDDVSALRSLRQQLAALDEAERSQQQQQEDATTTATTTMAAASDQIAMLSNGKRLLQYDSFLQHQRYYDDLKHVDCHYIQYNNNNNNNNVVVIEQDKSLGKGGLCWDAAFILAEYLAAQQQQQPHDVSSSSSSSSIRRRRVVELGAGTGLCGILLGKVLHNCEIAVTDLPKLFPLLQRNVQRNYHNDNDDNNMMDEERVLHEHLAATGTFVATRNKTSSSSSSSQSTVTASILPWGDLQAEAEHGLFDLVLGADVVASLYDPILLARCIHRMCRSGDSRVYISFKERLSILHRQFEDELQQLFGDIQIVDPTAAVDSSNSSSVGNFVSRNRNPDVKILIATGKK